MADDYADLVPREEAVRRVLQARIGATDRQDVESIAPGEGIQGRILADVIVAEEAIPAHDVATMDGFAVRAPVEYPVEVVDDVYPKDEPPSMKEGEAVRIATGAPLPRRANAVLRSEDATFKDGQLTGSDIRPGTFTYRRGTNVQAGETLFEAGETLRAADAVLLADLGIELVDVYAPYTVGVLATGSEIHEDPAADFDSKMLLELLRSWGAKATYEGTVPDAVGVVRSRIEELAKRYDVVITTGGTSVGPKDYVLKALSALGEISFHRVRIRPGKPLGLAALPETVAFAIPGKPIGAYAITTLVVRPFFTGEQQEPTVQATCPVDVGIGDPDFTHAIPVTLEGEQALPLGHSSSPLPIYEDVFDPSVLSSATRASRADGFALRGTDIEAGETITVVPFDCQE